MIIKDHALAVLRYAIKDQIDEWRLNNTPTHCAITGIALGGNYHVDHKAPRTFAQLVYNFLTETRPAPDILDENDKPYWGDRWDLTQRLVNALIENQDGMLDEWQKYHRTHAKLRAVCPTVNLKLDDPDIDWLSVGSQERRYDTQVDLILAPNAETEMLLIKKYPNSVITTRPKQWHPASLFNYVYKNVTRPNAVIINDLCKEPKYDYRRIFDLRTLTKDMIECSMTGFAGLRINEKSDQPITDHHDTGRTCDGYKESFGVHLIFSYDWVHTATVMSKMSFVELNWCYEKNRHYLGWDKDVPAVDEISKNPVDSLQST